MFVFLCLLMVSFIEAQDTQTKEIDLLKTPKYSWEPHESEILNVRAKDHAILLTITSCDIGSKGDEFNLLVTTEKDGPLKHDGMVFRNVREKKKVYFQYDQIKLQLSMRPVDKCDVLLEDGGSQEVSTMNPTTEGTTFPPGVLPFATVNISGVSQNTDTNQLTNSLKQSILNIANSYIEDQTVNLKETITLQDIQIKSLKRCPIVWPQYETCAILVFSLTATLEDPPREWSGYQFTKYHLEEMWKDYADKFLSDPLAVYTLPYNSITWWIVGITLIVVAFIVLLGVLKWSLREKRGRYRNTTIQEDLAQNNGSHDLDLSPSYYQDIPPMFDKYSNYHNIGKENAGFTLDEEIDSYDKKGH